MTKSLSLDRRSFLDAAGKCGAGILVSAGAAGVALAQDKKGKGEKKGGEKPEDVGPTEDLMREHGVLNRVLLAIIRKRSFLNFSRWRATSSRRRRSHQSDHPCRMVLRVERCHDSRSAY